MVRGALTLTPTLVNPKPFEWPGLVGRSVGRTVGLIGRADGLIGRTDGRTDPKVRSFKSVNPKPFESQGATLTPIGVRP